MNHWLHEGGSDENTDLLDDDMDRLHVSAGEHGCKRAQRKLVRAIRSIEETIEQVEDYI